MEDENQYDVIIIGAGASGLIAAHDLSASGKKVLLLEARARVGGRAFTVSNKHFSSPVETGAEFVHGRLPVTLGLLDKANLGYHLIEGKAYTVKHGKLTEDESFGADWQHVMKQLKSLDVDMTIADFLNLYFNEAKYKETQQAVRQFVQGFDAADPEKVSAFSLRKEWLNDDDEHQYRIANGYTALMQWLAEECKQNHTDIRLSHAVGCIKWQQQIVSVECNNGETFTAAKVIITIPLDVLQAGVASPAAIQFEPALDDKRKAFMQIGFGNVIKINVEFTEKIWETNKNHVMTNAGFIFSDALIPTWWTQNPVDDRTLNGWLAGPQSQQLNKLSLEQQTEKVIESLAYIFNTEQSFIKQKIKGMIITNWAEDNYAGGAYSFETPASISAKKIPFEPVANTIFFAGEACYSGPHTGTVEAAFFSGRQVAEEILHTF